jgi:glycosyltransferase involved in cell wall biosynthesis
VKVLLTHELFAPDFAGGGEYVALEMARHLRQRGVDLTVLTTGDPAIRSFEGIPTLRLPIHRYRMNLAWRAVARHAADADLIQTFNYHACMASLVAGKWLRKPVVCYALGLFRHAWIEMKGPLVGRLWERWERFELTRDFAKVLFASDYSRDQGIALGVAPERCLVNSPGIDPALPGEKRDVVLFSGKYDVRKGLYDILAVARALPDVRFELMGWGEQEQQFRREAPPNVTFVRFERGARLREAFSRARIFFLPSKAETFGIALVEAMAAGCAIVSTVPLQFSGVRVGAGDREAMTCAIRQLWADRGQCAEMGRRNQELAKVYSWDRHTSVLLDLYAQILGTR